MRLTGAVDGDGHLTDYGSDLERFPGTGAEALALMLAEQLACVHEIALVLSVLGSGRLFGKKSDCILRIDPLWPAGWRIGAAQRHRALAIGCQDDLDVLLRVCELWQAHPSPADWCATWWINEQALADAWLTAMESVRAVSAAMKGEASRPVMPALADRVRGILTRAMVSLRYDRIEGSNYRQATTTEREPEEVTVRSPLVEPSGTLLAFKRFRLPGASPDSRGHAVVSHIVRIADWVVSVEAASVELGLDLIVGTASNSRARGERQEDPLKEVRIHLPIGTIVDLELGDGEPDGRRVLEVATVVQGLPVPVGSPALDDSESDSSQSGFDRDWDPVRLAGADVPEEELAQQILNPRDIELNDVGNTKDQPAPPVLASAGPLPLERLRVVSAWPMLPLSTDSRCRIVGYSVLDAIHVALLVEPLSPSADLLPDPASHPDLRVGDDVEVIVCGEVRDHERGFIQFVRADLRGYFVLDAMTPGLNPYDREFLKRLKPGAALTAVLIPTDRKGVLAPTLLPSVGASLGKAPSVVATVHGETAQFYSATIVQGLNEWGKAGIELDYGDPEKGISHRFEVRQNHLRFISDSGSMVGQSVLIALAPSRGRSKTELIFDRKNKKLTAFLASHPDAFDASGDAIRFLKNDVARTLVRSLAECSSSLRWSRDVWESYAGGFHRTVRAARPVPAKRRVSLPPAIFSLVRERRREFQDLCGGTLRVDHAGTEIEIVASDAASADTAAASMAAIVELPRAFARVPSGAMGRVVGKEHTNRKALENRPGIRWVWTDENDLGVVGDTPQAVSRVMEEIRALVDSATGELIVPSGKNGYLIGTKGATVDRIKKATGCQAWNKDRGQLWVIEGPSVAAVEDFIRQANQIVGGSGRITATRQLEVTENTAIKPRSIRTKPVATPPTMPRPPRVPRVLTPESAARPTRPEAKLGCFIATACYGDPAHADVVVLRRWRDEQLTLTSSGRWFVWVYCQISPAIASRLARCPWMASLARDLVLRPVVRAVRHLLRS